MSGVSLPVTRPIGRALIVANPAGRADLLSAMQRLGYGATELDDPYAAMAELCRRPLAYRAVVLSLAGLYREELNLMPAIKRRFPHIEIWLSHTDGHQGALADAMRLGADGLLADDGLHRVALGAPALAEHGSTFASSAEAIAATAAADDPPRATNHEHESGNGEPVLTADELRALLQEQTSGGEEE
jgi:DNA-binding NarL/FixJ family response regulator